MKKLVITLLILVGLLVVADFAAAAAAEYQVSKKVREELKLTADPAVRINGFPFLYPALDGDYREIKVEANGVPVGRLRDVQVEATMRHVRAPLSDLTSGNTNNLKIDLAEGGAKIREADVGRLLDIPDLRIEPATKDDLRDENDVSDGATDTKPVDNTTAPVKLIGSTNIAGKKTEVTVVGVLSLVDGQIQVSPVKVELSNDITKVTLPPTVERALRQTFTTRINPGALPFTVVPKSVHVEHGTLSVRGEAKNVTFKNVGTGGGR